ncbi:MAG: hypothetical protein KGD72_11525, partial [Candidatus Lokiarchaeota archaeon]|nr:hypothetical protein [Candidatus Lokiarchaeota archaeon]
MVEKHSQSFFGQSTGLTLLSSSKSDSFIFFKCIKKKPDGSWEKPSLGEGKTIKCNLDEIVMILEVLQRNSDSWSSYHNFKDVKTQISFKWEGGAKKKLLIYIGNYSKMLNFSQTEIFRLLLKHILEEKIEFATILKIPSGKTVVSGPKSIEQRNQDNNATVLPTVKESIENNENEVSQINGVIEGETEKALLIQFNKDK